MLTNKQINDAGFTPFRYDINTDRFALHLDGKSTYANSNEVMQFCVTLKELPESLQCLEFRVIKNDDARKFFEEHQYVKV